MHMTNDKGQSLFELLVAVSVVSVFLVALVGAVIKSISNSTFSRNKALATKYTEEAVEWVRGQRDMDWDAFYGNSSPTPGGVWCLSTLNWNSGGCGSSDFVTGTKLTREMIMTSLDPSRVEVLLVVGWDSPSGNHESRTRLILTNWRGG